MYLQIVLSKLRLVGECQISTHSIILSTNKMLLSIMSPEALHILVHLEFNQTRVLVSNLLALLFAHVTEVMLLSEVLVYAVLIVEMHPVAELTMLMVEVFVVVQLTPFVQYLFK